MLEEHEKEEIILEVIERILTKMPAVIGNLMAEHAKINKAKTQFYAENKSFKYHKDIVASVIEKFEGESLSQTPEEILAKAAPEIKKRIALLSKLDTENIDEPKSKTVLEDFSNGLI